MHDDGSVCGGVLQFGAGCLGVSQHVTSLGTGCVGVLQSDVCAEAIVGLPTGSGCTRISAFGNDGVEVIIWGGISEIWFAGKGVTIIEDGTVCVGVLVFTGCVGVSQGVCLGVSHTGMGCVRATDGCVVKAVSVWFGAGAVDLATGMGDGTFCVGVLTFPDCVGV